MATSLHPKAIWEPPATSHLMSMQKTVMLGDSKSFKALSQELGTKSKYYTKRCSYHRIIQGIIRVLEALFLEHGMKSKYVFLIVLQLHKRLIHHFMHIKLKTR